MAGSVTRRGAASCAAWLRSQGIQFPLRRFPGDQLRWVEPSYHQVHGVLTNPFYAGAYLFGRRRTERYVDRDVHPRKRAGDGRSLLLDHLSDDDRQRVMCLRPR
jgi:Recombinase